MAGTRDKLITSHANGLSLDDNNLHPSSLIPHPSVVGRNHSAGKHYNRALLLRLVLQQGPISRLELSRLTRLSPAALTILTGQFLEEGRLLEVGERESDEEASRAGRRSTLLDLDADSAFAIGVHIAPRAVRVGLVDLKGQIRAKTKLGPPSQDASVALDEIAEGVRQLLHENRLSPQQLLGVGVGTVGLVEHERGINLSALSLRWHNIPIRAELEKRLELPVLVDNNARTMALAEHLFGRGEPYRVANLALIYAGAGIGCGLIISGQPYRGSAGAAGEIGHIKVVPSGAPCYCGGQGCLETVASEASLLRQSQHLGGQPDKIDLATLAEALKAGDEVVVQLLARAGESLAMAVLAVAKVLNPETIVLAGPLMDERLKLFEKVHAVITASASTSGGTRLILRTSLGDEIGITGGAALVLYERVFSPQS